MNVTPAATIAVLFSGGDAPGMNPFLRALVRLGLNRHGVGVLGVKDGYLGLVRTSDRLASGELTLERLRADLYAHPGRDGLHRRAQDLVCLDHLSVSGIVGRGGIRLGCARCPTFTKQDVRSPVIELLNELAVDTLVVVGGDGSMRGAGRIATESQVQVIGVPATIDNDMPVTELALGMDTAVNTLVSSISNFGDTASSHHRIMVIETMGRDSGQLAQAAALASGAEVAVTPERGPLDNRKMLGIAERLESSIRHGRQHAIVVVAEGVRVEEPNHGGPAQTLANYLQAHFSRTAGPYAELEIRASVLGHIQRGGSPTAADRILAARYAEAAWDEIAGASRRSGVLGLRRGRIGLYAFEEPADSEQEELTRRMYLLQKAISKW